MPELEAEMGVLRTRAEQAEAEAARLEEVLAVRRCSRVCTPRP